MLWMIFVTLVIAWRLGLAFQLGGSLIYLLLIAGLAVLAVDLLSGNTSLWLWGRRHEALAKAR